MKENGRLRNKANAKWALISKRHSEKDLNRKSKALRREEATAYVLNSWNSWGQFELNQRIAQGRFP